MKSICFAFSMIFLLLYAGEGGGSRKAAVSVSAVQKADEGNHIQGEIPPWVPYMEGVNGIAYPGFLHKKRYTVMDTLRDELPPDSVLLAVETERGDREHIWLHRTDPSPYFPGTVKFSAQLYEEYGMIPGRYDGTLQKYSNGPDAITMKYRSFNDLRTYSLKLSW
jgi:hypothetical protein